ncbi:MAG: aldehyde ferredoxin oxidoreductase family protein [Thermodesulfobacteriota bacterium]|nr:aldehyde ferredoxin oxidoreductase family protein [Thermodesulfobacteriota bacterium]
MNGGYAGKILQVDLTRGKISTRDLEEKEVREYIGGGGLATRILWDKTTRATEPFSPENPLMFMVGPLTGTKVPTNSHYSVTAISPLTGIFGDARSGGSWAYQLKHAGFDGVIFEGKSEEPVYLWIHDGEAELRDAKSVWGKGVFATDETLLKETDKRASVAAIGPAGEKLVRIACIINDGTAGRAAARCGLGAVMGSKKLKAVVVRGTKAPQIYSNDKLNESIKQFVGMSRMNSKEGENLKQFMAHRQAHWQKGRISIQNFLAGDFPGFQEKIVAMMLSGDKYFCRTCTTSSHECHMVNGRRRQVLESMVPLGSQCLIDDVEVLQEAYDLCQDYGMDSISTGGVMAFAIEAFEKGLVTERETEGIALRWGDARSMLRMVRKIGEREGFGEVLGEGVKRAAQHLGGLASEYAIHIKGLELPLHDPRSSNTIALEYATASRGADHVSAYAIADRYISPELGILEDRSTLENRFKVEGQAESVSKMQDYMCLFNSLILCIFLCRVQYGTVGAQPSLLADWIRFVTGWDMDSKELLKAGERIFNLQRLFNVRLGMSRKDDTLPPRILTHKRGGKTDAAENLPPLGEMLNRYYKYRGWTEEGIPTAQKIAELGLEADVNIK